MDKNYKIKRIKYIKEPNIRKPFIGKFYNDIIEQDKKQQLSY